MFLRLAIRYTDNESVGRICPGRYFAESSIWYATAGLLSCFEVTCPVGNDGKPIIPGEEMLSGLVACVYSPIESMWEHADGTCEAFPFHSDASLRRDRSCTLSSSGPSSRAATPHCGCAVDAGLRERGCGAAEFTRIDELPVDAKLMSSARDAGRPRWRTGTRGRSSCRARARRRAQRRAGSPSSCASPCAPTP